MSQQTGKEVIYIGPRLFLEGFSEEFYGKLKESCTRDNPAWFQWEALAKVKTWMKRKMTNPHSKHVHTFELSREGMFVLRGFRKRVQELYPNARVVDLRVAPPASKPFVLADTSLIPDDYQLAGRDEIGRAHV